MIWILILVVSTVAISSGLALLDLVLRARVGEIRPPRVVCGHCGGRHEVGR